MLSGAHHAFQGFLHSMPDTIYLVNSINLSLFLVMDFVACGVASRSGQSQSAVN